MKHALRLAVCCLLLVVGTDLLADPCGMVPPRNLGHTLIRKGLQMTYVFFRDGIETIAIRPGFAGSASEFGMLVPFPSPPTVKKAPQDLFEQIAAAIDPPEVHVAVTRRRGPVSYGGPATGGPGTGGPAVKKEEVVVLDRDAVGMYELVVLAAGSAAALERWMTEHGFRFPVGMDRACEQYIEQGWCFVAVKVRVGLASGAQPRPGQRSVDVDLPPGARFEGAVQAMAFRFRTPEPVVPMRLSAFNEGSLRNILYVLTDRPLRLRSLPSELVVRQVDGRRLRRNLTEPLPMRVSGGTAEDIPLARRATLPTERAPGPHNGRAGRLFAGDLRAAGLDLLILDHEEVEKELATVAATLRLGTPELDDLLTAAAEEQAARARRQALRNLDDLTLTVIDGDLPREFLADTDLTFEEFAMSSERNRPERYDAREFGPAKKRSGRLIR